MGADDSLLWPLQVIPGKFIAFAGPSYNGWTPPPAYYAEHFKRLGVSTVIRTNQKLYDASEFTRQVMVVAPTAAAAH